MIPRACLVTASLVATLGLVAPPAAAQAGKAAPAARDGGGWLERWLFLGRRTDKGWNPPSVSIAPPAYPAKAGNRITVKRHALAYGSVDCKVVDAADFKSYEEVAPSVELVKAGEEALEIVGTPIECPSVCGAKTVWVNVRIPAARLVVIEP